MKKQASGVDIIDVVTERRVAARKKEFMETLRNLVCELIGADGPIETRQIVSGICRGVWPPELQDKERRAVVKNIDKLLLGLEKA